MSSVVSCATTESARNDCLPLDVQLDIKTVRQDILKAPEPCAMALGEAQGGWEVRMGFSVTAATAMSREEAWE